MRPIVVFTDGSIRREAVELLAPSCDVRVLEAYPTEDALTAACRDAHAILARLGTVTRRVISAAPQLRIIARHGVGVDAVDLAAATERGVVVTTTGSVNAAAVAEYSFALLLALARKIVRADGGMRDGAWSRDALVGTELDGCTLGVIGLGAIGRRVARAGHGFGMRVLAHDPAVANDPVDFTGGAFVVGGAATFPGGVTSAQGKGVRPGTTTDPSATGAGDAGRGRAPSRARPVSLDQAAWSCPWPAEADAEQVNEKTVVLRVRVKADGRAEAVDVLSDPGFGFGAAARACALITRFEPARDAGGQPIAALSAPIRVHFSR